MLNQSERQQLTAEERQHPWASGFADSMVARQQAGVCSRVTGDAQAGCSVTVTDAYRKAQGKH